MGQADDEKMLAMVASFIPWVRERLKADTYVGWFWEEDGRVVAGGWDVVDGLSAALDGFGAGEGLFAELLCRSCVSRAGYARELLETAVGDAAARDQSGFATRVDFWKAVV